MPLMETVVSPLTGWVALTLAGLCIGSFLNVVIYRLPLMIARGDNDTLPPLTLFRPASHCPACGVPPGWLALIPVLSWWWLRGKCRHCAIPIPVRYPLTEAVTLAITLFIGWLLPPGGELVGMLIFSWLLLALAAIDGMTYLLPDALNGLLLWSGLLFTLCYQRDALPDAITGAAAGYCVLRLFTTIVSNMSGKICMGQGDFKLTAALGAWTGWQNLPLLLLIASLCGISWALVARGVFARKLSAPIPFGPPLALSGWLLVIYARF